MNRALLAAVLLSSAVAAADKPHPKKPSAQPQVWPPGPEETAPKKPAPPEPPPAPVEELPPVPAPPPKPAPAEADDADDACAEAFDDCREDCTIAHATDDTLHLPKGKKPPIVRCIARCQSARDGCEERQGAGLEPASRPHDE